MALKVNQRVKEEKQKPFFWLVQGRLNTKHLKGVPVFDYVQAFTQAGAIRRLQKAYPEAYRIHAKKLKEKS